MPHKRQLIRQALVAAVDATAELAGRTFSTRLRTTEIDEMPVALIYALSETSTHVDVQMDLQRTVQTVIEIKAAAPNSGDIADVLDDLAAAVETAIYADTTLGGLALGLELVETKIGLDGAGDARDGAALLAFDVLYVTPRP